jgi:nucleotide-binding universal stress UspA family protein
MANPILVGYDPGRRDRAPVDFGVAAANFTGAPLIIAAAYAGTATFDPRAEAIVEDGLEEGAGESLDHLAEELRRQGVEAECRALAGASAPRALHEAAEQFAAGLVVIGSTERGSVGRLLPGSTAERLMHGAPCPIAVVPHSLEPGGDLNTIGVAWVDTRATRSSRARCARRPSGPWPTPPPGGRHRGGARRERRRPRRLPDRRFRGARPAQLRLARLRPDPGCAARRRVTARHDGGALPGDRARAGGLERARGAHR